MNRPISPPEADPPLVEKVSPLVRRCNLPAGQQFTQRIVDEFNADESLWESLAPLRKLRRLLHPKMSRRKRQQLDLAEFVRHQPPKDCIGHRRLS